MPQLLIFGCNMGVASLAQVMPQMQAQASVPHFKAFARCGFQEPCRSVQLSHWTDHHMQGLMESICKPCMVAGSSYEGCI